MRALDGSIWLLCAAVFAGCGAGEDDSSLTTASTTDGTAAVSSGSGAGGSGGSPGVSASWQISSNIQINGHSMQDDARSATALHDQIDGVDYLSVVLTDVPAY